MNQTDFSARLLAPGTWQICGAGCDCYLLEGTDEALMVDAGCSRTSIRAFAQTLTPKPLRRVINTHSHFDHTGGNGYFDEVLITQAASRSAKTVMDDAPGYFRLDYDFTFIEDGQLIDPGGRPLRVVALGSHSPGSIAIWDEARRLLFCGDEIDADQVLLLPGYAEAPGQIHAAPAASVQHCLRSMQRLKALLGGSGALCPAHNGAPLHPLYLDWMAQLCENILSGQHGGADCASRSYHPTDTHYPYPGAGYLRAHYKGAALVYNRRLLRDEDLPNAAALPPATPLHLMCSYMTYDGLKENTL